MKGLYRTELMTLREFFAILSLGFLILFVHTMSFNEEVKAEAERNENIAKHYATMVAGCLNNGAISWYDPMDEEHKLTFCDTHSAKVMK